MVTKKFYVFEGRRLGRHEICKILAERSGLSSELVWGRLKNFGLDVKRLTAPLGYKGFSGMAKTVYAMKDGVEQRFNSVKDAAKALKLYGGNVSLAVNGKQVHSGGYKFRFENDKYNDSPIMSREEERIHMRNVMMENSRRRHALKIRHCEVCNRDKDKSFFRPKNFRTCEECEAKRKGIKEFGRTKKIRELFDKGFGKCCVCKKIKLLNDFHKNKGQYGGISKVCKECNHKLLREKQIEWRERISRTYCLNVARSKFGIQRENFTPELEETIRLDILARRATKKMFRFEGQRFSLQELANYIEKKYGIHRDRTKGRISNSGATIRQCLLSESEWRSQEYSQPVTVVNQQTGGVQKFKSLSQCATRIHVGRTILSECLKSGKPTRLYHTSKTKYTYKIYETKTENESAKHVA